MADTISNMQAEMRAAEAASVVRRQQVKQAVLELMIQNGIYSITAEARGSSDSGAMEEINCYEIDPTEPASEDGTPAQVECEAPAEMEGLLEELMNSSSVNFNNDGGFWELSLDVSTREFSETVGWYYTESNQETYTETL